MVPTSLTMLPQHADNAPCGVPVQFTKQCKKQARKLVENLEAQEEKERVALTVSAEVYKVAKVRAVAGWLRVWWTNVLA